MAHDRPEIIAPPVVALGRRLRGKGSLRLDLEVGLAELRLGAPVAVTQRLGSTINLHLHLHVLVLDGVYTASETVADDEAEGLVFHPLLWRLTEADERYVAERVHHRMVRLFRRRGWMAAPDILSSRSTSHIVWVGRDWRALFPGPGGRGLTLGRAGPFREGG